MKKEKRLERREIRDVLLGKMVVDEEGRLTTPQSGSIFLSQGIADGAVSVRFFGIKGKSCCYATETGKEELMAEALESMRKLGRILYLREQPETAACLLRYVMTRPAVLTFRYEEDQPMLTAWTGRGLFGWVSRIRAIRAFERGLSEELRPAEGGKTEKNRRKDRQELREEQTDSHETDEEFAPEDQLEEEYWEDQPEEGYPEDQPEEEYWEDQPEDSRRAEQEDTEA